MKNDTLKWQKASLEIRKRRPSADVPLYQLYREVCAGADKFWARRGQAPQVYDWQNYKGGIK